VFCMYIQSKQRNTMESGTGRSSQKADRW
jgi:hypothetical protein